MPIRFFISYSRADSRWFKPDAMGPYEFDLIPWLVNQLKSKSVAKELNDTVEIWWDERLNEHTEAFKTVIRRKISEAHFAIILVSTEFLNSKFIDEDEFPLLKKRTDEGSLFLIPIYVAEPANTKDEKKEWLSTVQGLPLDPKTHHLTYLNLLTEPLHVWQGVRNAILDSILGRMRDAQGRRPDLFPAAEIPSTLNPSRKSADAERQNDGPEQMPTEPSVKDGVAKGPDLSPAQAEIVTSHPAWRSVRYASAVAIGVGIVGILWFVLNTPAPIPPPPGLLLEHEAELDTSGGGVVRDRSEASAAKSLLLVQNQQAAWTAILPQDGSYELDVQYSNDGPTDLVSVMIDGQEPVSFETKKTGSFGNGWNKFVTATCMVGPLSRGKCEIVLMVEKADEKGVEIDRMQLRMVGDNPKN